MDRSALCRALRGTRIIATPLELTFLGSGNAFADGRYWSSFLANDRYLFDASPIALPHLKKAGKRLTDIEAIFISHFHADHWFGLPFLLLEYKHRTPRDKPLAIVGPPGIEEMVTTVTRAGFPGALDDPGYELRWVEVTDGRDGEAAEATYVARQVVHAEGMMCYGYRAEIDGRTLAYSGDTVMCDALLPLAQGADAFVVECSCWEAICGPHLSPRDIAELRRRIDTSTRFVLTHMDAGRGPFGDDLLVADDLRTIRI